MENKKIHSAIFYFVINLILPGLSQLALGFYLRGLFQLLGTLFCLVMAMAKLLVPLIEDIRMMLASDNSVMEMPDLKSIIIYSSVFILIWCWSLMEIPFLLRRKQVAVVLEK